MYSEFVASQFSKTGEIVLVPWNTPEGIRRLERSKYKMGFYRLAHNFQPQINPLYCGIATAVIILNAFRSTKGNIPSQRNLEVSTPRSWGGKRIPFPSYSQLTFLNKETDRVKSKKIINLENLKSNDRLNGSKLDPGLSLSDLKKVLEVYGLKVKMNYADKKSAAGTEIFRKVLLKVLNDENKFIVVNFKGSSMGAKTDGHISPLAAYDSQSDSVLILDVAGYKNPWYWAPIEHLYQAMSTLDNNITRGWLIISDK
jgi:hypothetical protein